MAPDRGPRTKPKALNAALLFARGEYTVVYDAEDRPDPDQLFNALECFWRGGDKLACVQGIARELGLDLMQVAFMGDDLPDLKVMRHVGVSACPADAHPWLAREAAWRAPQPGGRGAARAFCDMLLDAQDRVDALLDDLLAVQPVALGARA